MNQILNRSEVDLLYFLVLYNFRNILCKTIFLGFCNKFSQFDNYDQRAFGLAGGYNHLYLKVHVLVLIPIHFDLLTFAQFQL